MEKLLVIKTTAGMLIGKQLWIKKLKWGMILNIHLEKLNMWTGFN